MKEFNDGTKENLWLDRPDGGSVRGIRPARPGRSGPLRLPSAVRAAAMLPNKEPLLQYRWNRLCGRMRHDLWDKRHLQYRHDEPRWLDGTGPGSQRGTGSRPRAEHMILTCGIQFAVSLGQLLRENCGTGSVGADGGWKVF